MRRSFWRNSFQELYEVNEVRFSVVVAGMENMDRGFFQESGRSRSCTLHSGLLRGHHWGCGSDRKRAGHVRLLQVGSQASCVSVYCNEAVALFDVKCPSEQSFWRKAFYFSPLLLYSSGNFQFKFAFISVSSAHKCCIYLIKNTVKIVKYYCNSK